MENPRKFATIDDWLLISGLSRRVTYERLGTGDLKAIKVGSRTLLDVEHGLAWLRSRPPARIRAPHKYNTTSISAGNRPPRGAR